VTVKRLLAVLSLALAVRRHQRRVERGLRIVKRGVLVAAVAVGVAAVVWNRRKRAQAEEVPTGSKPIEGVGTAIP
jgi:hypothetical protein